MDSIIKRKKFIREHIIFPITLLFSIFLIGTMGYKVMNWDEWSLIDCAYMTSITLTTVGYGDILGIENSLLAKIYTILLMITGMGIVMYAVSTLTAFIVEGEMKAYFAESKMMKKIEKLSDHYIICGAGATGVYVIEEFFKTDQSFVVIDTDQHNINEITKNHEGILYLLGDATDDEILISANIHHARGLIAILPSDKENLFLVVSAKALNPKLKIAARAIDSNFIQKLRNVGAQVIVSPNAIGGMRIASEIIRPHVVSFLDSMLRNRDGVIRVGEIIIPAKSRLVNRPLKDAHIHKNTGLLVIALKQPDINQYIYNPGGDLIIKENSVFIVIGSLQQISELEKYVSA